MDKYFYLVKNNGGLVSEGISGLKRDFKVRASKYLKLENNLYII